MPTANGVQIKNASFVFGDAFSRNIGWVTEWEQQVLRSSKKVAIAGMGGVGGAHLLTLARLGVGAFHIADFDSFELPNFNRQVGAMLSTLGQSKVEVMAQMARDINPELALTLFPAGVDRDNIDAFLEGVDLFIDGFDFFVLDIRARVFARCAEIGIPAITAAPIGMGAAYLAFMPGHMSFEEYFRLEGIPLERQYVNFLVGLAPKAFHRAYLVDPSRLDLAAQRAPSTTMGCQLCAGITGVEALKILLGRGPIRPAPYYHHFDAYRSKWHLGWLPGGNRHPIQRLKSKIGYRRLAQISHHAPTVGLPKTRSKIERVLDIARWAPSGDNTQPWRFEIKDQYHVLVHGSDTREHCVYDLKGRASQISIGALLESIAIAATSYGLCTEISRVPDTAEVAPRFDVRFVPEANIRPDPLWPYIPIRSTQRRAMSLRTLTPREKRLLEKAVEPSFSIHWFEGLGSRLKIARLLFMNGKLRLTMPEAYEVHRSIIEWDAQFSEDRIPDQAIGLDPLGVRLMRWALERWQRVKFLNTYLGGTWLPRIQLDFFPSIACASHFLIVAAKPPQSMDDYIAAGRVWQRFWLTATRLNLRLQPEMTPLIFSSYIRDGVEFSKNQSSLQLAARLSSQFDQLVSPEMSRRSLVMGRIGAGPAPKARSVRLSLERLIIS